MGGADIIPGVSGGTVALILGIYDRLVTAISRFDLQLLKHIKDRQWKAAAEHIDFRFLAGLGTGVGCGIVGLASLMHYLLDHHWQMTFAAFFGLIFASSFLVGRMVTKWAPAEIVALIGGALGAYALVGLPLLDNPPDHPVYVFFCGTIGICAMILPGISGSFILLLLGKYSDITGMIKSVPKQLLAGQFPINELITLTIFAAGCAIGLITFSKFLRWLLKRHYSITMALLCGFMAGSLRKIWPFKIDNTPDVTEFKQKVFENIPLNGITIDGTFWTLIGVIVVSAAFVLVLDFVTSGHDQPTTAPAEAS